MIGLRAGAAVGALVVFLEPAVELRQVAREPNRIAVLVDDSASMALAERPGGPTRIERARELLGVVEDDARRAGASDHKLDYYTFAETIARDVARGRSQTTAATGKATLIRKALEQVRGRYEGRDLAGVVLISDGAATGGFGEDAGDGAVRDFLRSLDTRVHTVWAARAGLKDVAVAKVHRRRVRVRSHRRAHRRRDPHDRPARRARCRSRCRPTASRCARSSSTCPRATARSPCRSRSRRRASAATSTRSRVRSPTGEAVTDEQHAQLRHPRHPRQDPRAPGRRRSRRGTCARCAQMLKSNPNVDLISFFILRTQDEHLARARTTRCR